ncbi:MAG: DUF4160 domain-containing protein [Oscillospiraceae bacterium]|nr:DUF4160 domain-containing protein [Oscillospiraceae bacterium]
MPKLISVGQYIIFFWSCENDEPIHVHISVKKISPNATKIWLTESGGCIVSNNNSRIPQKELNKLLDIICDKHTDICDEWKDFFSTEEIKFYC